MSKPWRLAAEYKALQQAASKGFTDVAAARFTEVGRHSSGGLNPLTGKRAADV